MVKSIAIKFKEIEYQVRVDDEDYALLIRHNWHLLPAGKHQRLYAFCPIYAGEGIRKMLQMTHLIMGSASGYDHIDNDSINNQKFNLRAATRLQNNVAKCKAPLKNGKPTASKYKGVQPSGKRWRAIIGHNRKVIQLGTYDTEDEAAIAYNIKAIELYGEWAWLNPVPGTIYAKSNDEARE